MKAYKVTLLVIDFDEIGDIGDWDDSHPLNTADRNLEFRRLFDDSHGGGEE